MRGAKKVHQFLICNGSEPTHNLSLDTVFEIFSKSLISFHWERALTCSAEQLFCCYFRHENSYETFWMIFKQCVHSIGQLAAAELGKTLDIIIQLEMQSKSILESSFWILEDFCEIQYKH